MTDPADELTDLDVANLAAVPVERRRPLVALIRKQIAQANRPKPERKRRAPAPRRSAWLGDTD